jgi:hypothetical protein
MIVHYTFDGNVLDSSGNGNDGTLTGSPGYVPGQSGEALYFDNPEGMTPATQFVTLPTLNSLTDQSFTVAIRFNSTDTTQQNGRLFGNNFTSAGFTMDYNRFLGANAEINVRDNGTTAAHFFDTSAGSEAHVTDGGWHWMVLVVDRSDSQARGYIDQAMQLRDVTGLGSVSFANLRIGASSDAGNPTGGDFGARLTAVDDFQLYDNPLTDQQVRALVSGDASVPEPSAFLLIACGLTVMALTSRLWHRAADGSEIRAGRPGTRSPFRRAVSAALEQ